jgi:hypothetical protein
MAVLAFVVTVIAVSAILMAVAVITAVVVAIVTTAIPRHGRAGGQRRHEEQKRQAGLDSVAHGAYLWCVGT